jgi:mono/diheme cytochrome c family protein
MDCRLRRFTARAASLAWPLLAATAPLLADDHPGPQQKSANGTGSASTKVTVELPVSEALFPARDGAEIANSQCLICHSADMVLYQPARTQDEWKVTINKMRTAYGAPIAADQIDALAAYLSSLR